MRSNGALAGSLRSGSNEARAAFADAAHGMLAHRADTSAHLDAALVADPSMVPALSLRAYGLRKLGQRDRWAEIRTILDAIPPTDDPRELALVRGLRAWLADDGPRAADLLDEQLTRDPRDLVIAKLVQGLRFMLGDSAGMRRSIERVLKGHGEADPGYGFLLGCHAFALEETHDYAQAERVGRHALELEPNDAWGAHAVAHVLFMEGRHDEGARWLSEYAPRLEGCSNFAGHVAWHEAVFLTELGRTDEALELFDRRVACHPDGDYRDVSNATSMLFRLERLGVDVGDRWGRYADLALTHEGDHGNAFADVHYALALAGAGRAADAARFVESMGSLEAGGFETRVSHDVGRPLARAVVDLHAGRANAAAEGLDALMDEAWRIGGSHAQRHLLIWIRDAARAEATR